MNQSTASRRYFVADGPDAQALIDRLLALQAEHSARVKEFLAEYNAPLVMQRDGYPTGILLAEGSAVPEGFKKLDRHQHEGKIYDFLQPVGNTKAGRAIKKRAQEVGFFSPSDIICAHYKVKGHSIITGGSMWVPVGWPSVEKRIVTLSIPVNESAPYSPMNPELREIKKSEYIAITEE